MVCGDTPRSCLSRVAAALPLASGSSEHALLALVYRGGLRVCEALPLCPKDSDALPGTVLEAEGGVDRFVGTSGAGGCTVS